MVRPFLMLDVLGIIDVFLSRFLVLCLIRRSRLRFCYFF